MRRPILAALAVLFFGTIVLPGCFYAGPGWWWDPDHDEGWHRHHDGRWEQNEEWRERHGALTPQRADPSRHDEDARRGDNDNTIG